MKVNITVFRFNWDAGNSGKNRKHHVEDSECEEVFFDQKKVFLKDKFHSANEDRYILLGKTKQARLLYIVFTIRNGKVRIISARDINKKEVHLYEKAA
jgi:uncharacterized DUF497 family protein